MFVLPPGLDDDVEVVGDALPNEVCIWRSTTVGEQEQEGPTFSLVTPCPEKVERGADLELTALREGHGVMYETDAVLERERAAGLCRLSGNLLETLGRVEDAVCIYTNELRL